MGLDGGRIGEDDMDVKIGVVTLLEIAVTSECDRKWVWLAMSNAEVPPSLLLLLRRDLRMRYMPTRMAASSTTMPPITPPTMAPTGVDFLEATISPTSGRSIKNKGHLSFLVW